MADLVILVALLLLSGFFSGSETALTTISVARAEALAEEKRHGARALLALKSRTDRMLITILIGNNLVNIGATAMATVIAIDMFGHLGLGLAIGALTLVIVIFGEVVPKTFAARHAVAISLVVATPLIFLERVLLPVVWLLERLSCWIRDRAPDSAEPMVTETELIRMTEYSAKEGAIEPAEENIIKRVFAFGDRRAEDVMIPRHRVICMDGRRILDDALDDLLDCGHSRIPLHTGTPDEIKGVVHLISAFGRVAKGQCEQSLLEIAVEPLFAPLNQPLDELLDILRGNKSRMVVVVNEFGVFQGILVLEDLLEELIGELYDEVDRPRDRILELPEGQFLIDGAVEMRRVEEHLGASLTDSPTDSVSLWILEHLERIPGAGERFTIGEVEVLVDTASQRHIDTVRLRRRDPGDGGPAET